MSVAPSASPSPRSAAEVDAVSRWPVLWLLAKAAGWLALGLVLMAWAWGQLLFPGALGTSAWNSYGRLWPAAQHVLFYGFATQAGLALGLWMLARLGGVGLQQRWLTCLGGALWNLGVILGTVGILAGDATGYPLWGAPIYGSGVMWAGLAALGVSAWFTLQQRARPAVYPAQWWAMAGVFWLFWLMTVGLVLLHCAPPRGVMQVVAGTWLANNLLVLWLSAAGLAAVFYFVPRYSGRPLHSVAMSKTVFWVVAVFGTAGGFHFGLPVPRWLPAVSAVADLLMLVAALALALNLHQTLGGQYRGLWRQPGLGLSLFGALMWVVAVVWQAAVSRPALQEVVNLTFLTAARPTLWMLGFALPVLAGGFMYVVPRLACGGEACTCTLSRGMAGCLMAGAVLWALGLLWAGNAQAGVLADWRQPFMTAVTAALPGLKLAGLGLLIMTVGGTALAGAVIYQGSRAMFQAVRTSCCPAPTSPAREVAA
ncbi:cbb3-type cytochrome c oxidase subunit I [Fontisphaera persica]|uniref:cbb3-type cytochrome c oxidase subunit I n=1 Tax=Fontisphaera persica TaxID=2974023 RepID=UPI0024BFE1E9|nr:cbb3-type cytochrome c oxidase subunit I [Fontisphaera persica]WCJ57826.1 cbb3-type cytochrome c oxidase subunit I [Fontisphaera persica]